MFGLFHRRRPPAPAAVAEAFCDGASVAHSATAPIKSAPSVSPVTVEMIRAVRAERRDAVDLRTFALGVLDHIRRTPGDVFYTHDEINAWALDFAAVGGLDISCIDLNRVRGVIKAQTEHVDYFEKRIRADDQFADLRARLKRARGAVPQKAWLFHIKTSLDAVATTSETVSPVLLQSAGGAAATTATVEGRSRAESTADGFQSEGRSRHGVTPESALFSGASDAHSASAPHPPRKTAYG